MKETREIIHEEACELAQAILPNVTPARIKYLIDRLDEAGYLADVYENGE